MADHDLYREEFPDEHPQSYDHTEPNGSLLFIFFGVTVILVGLIAIGVQFYYETFRDKEIYDRVLAPDNNQLVNLRSTEDKELHSFGYVDKNVGKVRLPIERAMQLIAAEARENRLRYPTSPYRMETPEEIAAAGSPAVSQPGAAAANNATNQGVTSNPNVQEQPAKPGR